MAQTRRPNGGLILWEGPSPLDGSPLVAIVTGIIRPSKNAKTGPMAQIFVLRQDVAPGAALRTGADAAVCFDCPLRGWSLCSRTGAQSRQVRRDYVDVTKVTSVWAAYHGGSYTRVSPRAAGAILVAHGRHVRGCAYGDPFALPAAVWAELLSTTGLRWTGYTHQWRRLSSAIWGRWFTASVETPEGYEEAVAAGWRTFRIIPVPAPGAAVPYLPGEQACPAAPEGGARTTCHVCRACRGTSCGARNIGILDHGPASRTRLQAWLAARCCD